MHWLQESELFWVSFRSRLPVLADDNSLLSQAQFYYGLTATNTLLKVMNIPTPLNINYINMAIGNLPSLQLPMKERALKFLQNAGHLHTKSLLSHHDA